MHSRDKKNNFLIREPTVYLAYLGRYRKCHFFRTRDVKLRIHLQTLHRVQEPIPKYDVRSFRVISTSINDGIPNSWLWTISIDFLTNTKHVHSSGGTMFVCSFPNSQDVKTLHGPFTKKMFAGVYAP